MNKKNNNVELRPMMKISEMVPYLKLKNIKFDLISEAEAEIYLKCNKFSRFGASVIEFWL